MQGLLAPEKVEETVGTAEVRQTFRASRIGTIAGCYVTDGDDPPRRRRAPRARRHASSTRPGSARCGASRTTSARSPTGYECGIVIEGYADVKEGDVFEAFETRQVEREL